MIGKKPVSLGRGAGIPCLLGGAYNRFTIPDFSIAETLLVSPHWNEVVFQSVELLLD
jgi:hypothetical protein